MKHLVLIIFFSIIASSASADTYCLGESYRRAYDFGTNYAVRCAGEEKLRSFHNQSRKEIMSELASDGINFVRSIGNDHLTDIYKIGTVSKDEASNTQIIFRFVSKKTRRNKESLEHLRLATSKSITRYYPEKGTATNYRRVNQIIEELGFIKAGIVDSINPKYSASANIANEVIIIRKKSS